MNEKEFKQKFADVLSVCNMTTLHPLDMQRIYDFLHENLNSHRDHDLMHEVLRVNYPDLGKVGQGKEWFSGFADCILIQKKIMP